VTYIGVVLGLLCTLLVNAYAQKIKAYVPVPMQVLLLMKSLVFEETLPERCADQVTFGVVHSNTKASLLVAKLFLQNFKRLYKEERLQGLPLKILRIPDKKLSEVLKSNRVDVLYIAPDVKNIGSIIQICKSKKILSVTGEPRLVQKGVVLGFGVRPDRRPQIFVNLSSAKESGIMFLPSFFNFAKVVR